MSSTVQIVKLKRHTSSLNCKLTIWVCDWIMKFILFSHLTCVNIFPLRLYKTLTIVFNFVFLFLSSPFPQVISSQFMGEICSEIFNTRNILVFVSILPTLISFSFSPKDNSMGIILNEPNNTSIQSWD